MRSDRGSSDILLRLRQPSPALCSSFSVTTFNRFVKRRVGHRHFVVRTLAFILLCGFGYGLLAVFLAPGIIAVLRHFGSQYIVLTVVGVFVWIGVMAERKRYM